MTEQAPMSDWFAQARQDRAGRLEWVDQKLGDFVRAYDRYMVAIGGTDEREINEATAELDREYEALDELTSLMPPADDGMTEQTLRRMRHRCGAVINLLYQCSDAVATRDGMGNCQSIGPDVALPVGGQGR